MTAISDLIEKYSLPEQARDVLTEEEASALIDEPIGEWDWRFPPNYRGGTAHVVYDADSRHYAVSSDGEPRGFITIAARVPGRTEALHVAAYLWNHEVIAEDGPEDPDLSPGTEEAARELATLAMARVDNPRRVGKQR